nr:hypothetical protein [uncultured Albidiferax sp.]
MLTPEINKRFSRALTHDRQVDKTPMFEQLLSTVGDEDMANAIWAYWGATSLKVLDSEIPALNPGRTLISRLLRRPQNTIRSLLRSIEGRQIVWQMLHDAGAWL